MNTPNVISANQRANLNKDNFNQGVYNFSTNTNSSAISPNGTIENRASNKGKQSTINSTNVKKQNKKTPISHKFTF